MEKLQANKVISDINIGLNNNNSTLKNSQRKPSLTNRKENVKNNKSNKKSNNLMFEKFLVVFKTCKISYIICCLLMTSVIVFAFLMFSNNTYFVFLKRPKILENGYLLATIISLFSVLLFLNFVLETQFGLGKEILVKNKENKNVIEKNEILKTNKKHKNIKLFSKKSAKKYNFKAYFAIFIQLLLLMLAFNIHSLWLCVFISFCSFFTLFIHLYKTKTIQNKIFDIVLILNYLCILLSFYFIYLYN